MKKRLISAVILILFIFSAVYAGNVPDESVRDIEDSIPEMIRTLNGLGRDLNGYNIKPDFSNVTIGAGYPFFTLNEEYALSDKKIGDIYNDVLDFSEGDLRVFILYVDDKPVFRILAGIHNGKWTPRSFGEDANDLDVAIKLLERKNSDLYISGELALDLSGPVPRVAYESTIYKAEEYFEYMQKYFSASRAAFEAYLKEETDYQEGDNINDYIQIGGDGFYGREAPPFTLEPYIEPQSVSYVPIIFGFSIVVAFVIFIILRRRYNAKRS